MNKEKQKTELDKCLNGCIVDGKKLTGRHYFYLNYVKINGASPVYTSKDAHFFNIWNKSLNNTLSNFKPFRIFWPIKYEGKTKGMILRK